MASITLITSCSRKEISKSTNHLFKYFIFCSYCYKAAPSVENEVQFETVTYQDVDPFNGNISSSDPLLPEPLEIFAPVTDFTEENEHSSMKPKRLFSMESILSVIRKPRCTVATMAQSLATNIHSGRFQTFSDVVSSNAEGTVE